MRNKVITTNSVRVRACACACEALPEGAATTEGLS